MKRVLVTGATGFIGRHTLSDLVRRGFDVHAVSSRPLVGAESPVNWHQADLLVPGHVPPLLERVRPSHLLHLAWFAVPGKFWTSPENLSWLRASLDLVQSFESAGGQRVVTAGTCAEYQRTDADCDEYLTPQQPETLYGTCKHALRLVVEKFADGRLSMAWGRVFHLYGPHEHPDRLVPSVIVSLLEGRPALCSPGTQVRDFLHVSDVAAAFVALLDSPVNGSVNLASGCPVSIAEVASAIGREMRSETLIRLGARPLPDHEQPRLTACVNRLRDEVRWTPAFDLERGIEQTVEWWRSASHAR